MRVRWECCEVRWEWECCEVRWECYEGEMGLL